MDRWMGRSLKEDQGRTREPGRRRVQPVKQPVEWLMVRELVQMVDQHAGRSTEGLVERV